MCVIAVSRKGDRQPTRAELLAMFNTNPHGAGYMLARDGHVEIHKGFMAFEDFWRSVRFECLTKADAVVYHFRISTQAGVNPEMTQPFPLTSRLPLMRKLDIISAPVGIAHNGIIALTSDPNEKTYSDTALFIGQFMTRLIHRRSDIDNPQTQTIIRKLIGDYSKLAILTGDGEVTTIGNFTEDNGILVSNLHHKEPPRKVIPVKNYTWQWDF